MNRNIWRRPIAVLGEYWLFSYTVPGLLLFRFWWAWRGKDLLLEDVKMLWQNAFMAFCGERCSGGGGEGFME